MKAALTVQMVGDEGDIQAALTRVRTVAFGMLAAGKRERVEYPYRGVEVRIEVRDVEETP